MIKRRLPRLILVGFAVVSSLARSGERVAAPGHSEPHMVFAHYMVCFAGSVEFYKQEIELAQRHGIDGFALNCGGWGTLDPKTGELKAGPYVQSAERMFEAARQLDSGFKLMLSPDLNGLGNLPENIGDMAKRFETHPNQFRYRGKQVISGWGGQPASYAEAIDRLRKEGHDVCFVPQVYNERWAMAWSPETVARFFENQPHMDGLFFFAADDTVAGLIRTQAIARQTTLALGKLFMAGVSPAFNSPNLRDFRGMHGYGAVWEAIIRDDADWVEVVTWNDYSEDSNLMVYRWKDGWEKQAFDRDESFLDVTGHYAAWFKSGVEPQIAQDKLYFVYRNRSHWLRQAWDVKQQKWVDITLCPWPFDQIHDDVEDNIYMTTFLTEPAELTVQIGRQKQEFAMPAGIAHAEAALKPGVPRFVLRRRGRVIADVIGRKQIIAAATKQNSPKGVIHFSNRTWSGAVAVGEAVRIEAESGTVHGAAVVVKQGSVTAVATTESEGSGFTVPVANLKTATYNIRIVYCNPSEREARLTLIADGPPRGEKEYPYFIPAFLPPTGRGKFAAASFFWSLYDKTTRLTLEWQAGHGYGDEQKNDPLFDDQGSVLVDAVELVKVEPVQVPTRRESVVPELIDIPGGSFTMGSDTADPDEAPSHKVKLSPFAIGKYEVTNEEYERFDPSHRRFRDGYSWRGREPVIYVSWTDAARYCNWLSRQTGLTPVYDEKTWRADLGANGFRMPTEAEWEYVASGRGEGRRYPWGNDVPVPGLHGNFAGAASLRVDPRVRSTQALGVMVVGSYPAGASRDGVMDLAGNVAEWCSDWFQPYSSDAQTDPCNQTPGNYRSIRGGSWDYYGYSQRCTDREFNNPNYPGYIYLGFRVVLPGSASRLVRGQGK